MPESRGRSPIFWTSQSCFLSSNWFFFECKHLFIDKPMVITEPTVPSARGLGSKLYPSNMTRILNKDVAHVLQSLS